MEIVPRSLRAGNLTSDATLSSLLICSGVMNAERSLSIDKGRDRCRGVSLLPWKNVTVDVERERNGRVLEAL